MKANMRRLVKRQMAMNKKTPMRRCVGCGEMRPKKELLRVIRNADGEIFLDTTGKKNGRGAYICGNSECLQRAERTKGLARSLKTEIPSEIYEDLKREMIQFENG